MFPPALASERSEKYLATVYPAGKDILASRTGSWSSNERNVAFEFPRVSIAGTSQQLFYLQPIPYTAP